MAPHYQGIPGSPGIAIGRAFCYQPAAPDLPPLGNEDPAAALKRFRAAQYTVVRYLTDLSEQLRAEGRHDEAAIFDAQALFAEDIAITDEVTRRVQQELEPLEIALTNAFEQVRTSIAALDDAYLRERAADIDSVGHIMALALSGKPLGASFANLPPDSIIIAPDLTPDETAQLRGQSVAGFATAHGGPTGHTAILARSLGIPAVVGLGTPILEIASTTEVILDGDTALLIVAPTPDERSRYQQRQTAFHTLQGQRLAARDQPGQMADGHPVALWANIGHPDEASQARTYGAEGIGLFRTEFLFLDRSTPPDEDEQYTAYRSVIETMTGHPVVIRTLDIGGDKAIPYLDMPPEANPMLGTRGLRLCMRQPELFRTQLRAILRAALHGDAWIMFPMVSTFDDLVWGKAQVQAAATSLAAEGTQHRPDVSLGIMIETPAAAVTADILAREVAFFSVGSNDLTQYTMAADRGMAAFATAYPHTAPAVLRLIAQAARAARDAGMPIGVCGELAGMPDVAPLLVGLGVSELSMAPAAIPLVKERLRAMTLAEAQTAAQQAMTPVGFGT